MGCFIVKYHDSYRKRSSVLVDYRVLFVFTNTQVNPSSNNSVTLVHSYHSPLTRCEYSLSSPSQTQQNTRLGSLVQGVLLTASPSSTDYSSDPQSTSDEMYITVM